MKKLNFTKMAGAGNDFIVLSSIPKGTNIRKLAIQACDRTNGIGADGLLILDKSKKADYKMRIINADGSEAEMCGNGARCLVAYIAKNKKPKKKNFTIDTLAGLVSGYVKNGVANVNLSDPVDFNPEISLKLLNRTLRVSYIDTGVPHTIIYVDHINTINVKKDRRTDPQSRLFSASRDECGFCRTDE